MLQLCVDWINLIKHRVHPQAQNAISSLREQERVCGSEMGGDADSNRISGSLQKCPQHGVVGSPKSVLTWSHSQVKTDGFRVLSGLEPLLHVAPGFGDALLTRRKEGCVRVHGAVHHGVFTHRASL